MKLDLYINIITLIVTALGFVIGFINLEYRVLAWSLSLIIATIVVISLVFRDYISKIEKNEKEIEEIKKDLNIMNRLSKLEGKIEFIEKRTK